MSAGGVSNEGRGSPQACQHSEISECPAVQACETPVQGAGEDPEGCGQHPVYAQLLLDTCPASCCVGAPATRASCPAAGPVSQRVPDVSAAETGSVRGLGKSYRRIAAEALRILKQVSVSLP